MVRNCVLALSAAALAASTLACAKGEAAELAQGPKFTQDGRGLIQSGITYRPIDDSGVFFYDGTGCVGCPMPDPGVDLRAALQRNGFHGIIRCSLVDYVDCSESGHGFNESGGSRVLKLGADRYRVTRAAGKLGWFSYELATDPKPGKPHLVVCQLINDRERYTTVTCNQAENTTWAPPYEGEEEYVPRNQEGNTWRCDVGAAVYTGREYYCDGKPYTFALLFYPKTDRAKITISHRADEVQFDELNGAAVARIWMFDVLDPLPPAVEDSAKNFNKAERKVALYVPHPWFLYSHFGIPSRQKDQRVKSLEETVRYLKFCGFNQLQLHIIDGSDRATSAWYDSKLYGNLEGNLFEELLPIAEREGIEVVPIVAPIISPFNKKPSEAPAQPDEHGWSRDSCLLDKEGEDYTRAFGGPAPNPLRPEVQDWQLACFKEILDRCAQSPAVPAVGFRVNGKIGLCFTGEQWNRCGQDAGYNQWMVDEFTRDTGIQVPKLQPTSYEYIHDHCWDEWLQWRCVRMRKFWLKCRDFIRSYRPDLKFLAACDLPSETPGYNIEWPSGDYSIRDLFRHHGYDPDLFKNDEGIWIQRGTMVASDRYWYWSWFPYEKNPYAHKMFNYAPGVAESYDVPDSSGVELYHNYWEEDPHPDPEYGPYMRTATPVAYKDFFYEPAVFSIRRANVDRIAFMGWERACAGHEHDLRRFARAFRAIPLGEPKPFEGKVDILSSGPQVPEDELPPGYEKPEMDVLSASWFGDRLVVINDAFCPREVRVSLTRPLKKGQCIIEHGSGNVVYRAASDGAAELVLSLHPFDLQVFSIADSHTAKAPSAEATSATQDSVTLRIAWDHETVTAGGDTDFALALTNNSSADIRDIIINVRLPEGWLEKADKRTLDRLAPGETYTFPVRAAVSMDAAGSTSRVRASASYTGPAGASSVRASAPACVSFPVVVSQAVPVYAGRAGETVNVVLELTNRTSDGIEGDLAVDLPAGWHAAETSRVDLAPGESRTLDLAVSISPSASPRRYESEAAFQIDGHESPSAPVVTEVTLGCPRLSTAPNVDGKLPEWRDRAAVLETQMFRVSEGADLGAVSALEPKAWLAWDDENLYIAAHTNDTDFRNPFPDNELWKGDSLQFGLDVYRLRPGPRGFFEYGFTRAEGGGARVRLFRTTRNKDGSRADSEGFSVIVDRTGTSFECAVRWADLGYKPKAGDVIGIALVINDFDGSRRRVVGFGDGLVDEKDPTGFIGVRLEE